MGQLGFFDADKRLQALSARGDPLEAIDHLVPWESFRAEIEAVVLTPDELKKSSAGRKPFDAILMFGCWSARQPTDGCWTRATPAMMCSLTGLSVGRDRGQTQGQRLQEPDSSTRSAQPPAVFGARASEPRQEPDTRSHRACVRGAAERAGRSDRAHDWHGAGARQDRLAEPGLQHSPPGDAGTARRGMKRWSRLQCSNRSSGRKKKP